MLIIDIPERSLYGTFRVKDLKKYKDLIKASVVNDEKNN